jgi:hypothetical protein
MKKHRNNNGCIQREQKNVRCDINEKKPIKFRPKETPGVICIERRVQDKTVLISGSLIIENDAAELNALIKEELELAAREIREFGGALGQLEAALTVTTTSVLTVSDEKAMEKDAPQKYSRITISAVVLNIDPKEAENVVRKSLAGIRTRLREKE